MTKEVIRRSTSPLAVLAVVALGVPALWLCACRGNAGSKTSPPSSSARPVESPASRPLTAAECDALWNRALAPIDAAAQRSRACAGDADCTLVPRPTCLLATCDQAIARAGAGDYASAQDHATKNDCAAWERAGCLTTTPKSVPTCPALAATCKAGTCTTVSR